MRPGGNRRLVRTGCSLAGFWLADNDNVVKVRGRVNDLYIQYVHLSDWSSMVGRVLVKKKNTYSKCTTSQSYVHIGWRERHMQQQRDPNECA